MPAPTLAIGSITGSASDVISVGLSLSDAMAPDKGFGYNLCAFEIDLRADSVGPQSAGLAGSASIPGRADPALLSGRRRDIKFEARPGPTIFSVTDYPDTRSPVLEIGVHQLISPDSIIGIVELKTLKEGFDDAFGDTLVVEVAAQPLTTVPHGVLLVIKGLINPVFFGFSHFIGAVLVFANPRGGPNLQSKALFVTQNPKPKGGVAERLIQARVAGGQINIEVV
jgi:hypothetical protein